ncbi:AAA family ATPase [Adhaeribacter aerolatus]|uniref:AAA family ATPase n=1 Tax=Adhaeribacter aerolatus TaxID=670289 RepID=UPI001478C407|nr:adenylate/guanylate cyclase domain-containing protein [Adhaeribacter aerolatus]
MLKYDGLLNQVWMDEKDSNLLICFGPPPSAHMDNPERSVRLALEIHHLLNKSGYVNTIGISGGMAYCGILGNDILRQYTVIGDVVNLSARITSIAQNKVLCDKATYHASNKIVNYEAPLIQNIKGFAEPVSLYEPKNLLEHNQNALNIPQSVGRHAELTQLMDAFNNTLSGKSACILLEGDSGMGKTRLLEDFKAQVLPGQGVLLPTSGDFISRHTPYIIWVNIFSTLLGLNQVTSAKDKQEALKVIEAKYGGKACLLNVVLQSNYKDSEEVKSLTESQKVVVTHHFLFQILEEESRKQPLVIVIDDAQWMVDEASWNLIKAVNADLNSCLLVMSFQKTEGFPEVKALQDKNAQRIILQELPDEAIDKLIYAKLNTKRISDEVSELVKKIAKGNPFFCLELAGSLLDQELLSFENDSCAFNTDVSIHKLSMPETVRGAVRQRIDRLNHGSQLSLKVASVVGNRFGKKIVTSIYPIKTERKLVPAFLQDAEKAGFINTQVVDNLEGYLFNNATTSEVAYEMTLAEQRRYLHRVSAEWYENNFRENLYPYYVRLADHWLKAGDNNKASDYHEKEAIRLFRLGFVKQALAVGLEGVKLLNPAFDWEQATLGQKIGEHLAFIHTYMQTRSIESLLDQKQLNNSNTEKVIKILLELAPFAHQSQQVELFAFMSIMCLRLTLEEGNGQSAAEVYSMYAIIHKSLTNDSAAALAWSNLALAVDKKNNHTLQARVSFIHGWFIAHWLVPHKDLIAIANEGADAGFKSGDILFGCFSLSLAVVLKSTAGLPLSEVITTAENHLIRNNHTVLNAAFHLVHEAQVAKALQGRTTAFTSLTDNQYEETKDLASICNTDLYNQIGYYLISKLKLNAHFGNWEEAIKWGNQALPLLPAFAHQPGEIDLEQFYTIAALYRATETSDQASDKLMHIANTSIHKISAWATLSPGNFSHKLLLLQGIREGLNGDLAVAEQMFELAAEKALTVGYIQDRALAYEHLARIQKRFGVNTEKALKASLDAYSSWGATGKVKYLHEQFTD